MVSSPTNTKHPDTPKRVALYLRCSTMEQANEWYGLESQERILLAYVEANKDNNWISSDALIYREEGFSGATPVSERPELSRLQADILQKKVDIVLIWKIDRLFRKSSYLLAFLDFLKDENISLVSKTENIDLSTYTGKLIVSLFWAMAEAERETIAERTMNGKLSKAMDGYMVYGRFYPYGYRAKHDGKWNRMVVFSEEAKIVQEIFTMFVDEWLGTGKIARILTARDIGSNIDNTVLNNTPLRKKTHKNLFRQSMIRDILRNTTYIWEYACNKTRTVKENGKMVKKPRDPTEWVRTPCEAIVDRGLFQKAQILLDQSPVLYRRGETHIFTGLIKCVHCGRSFNYYLSHKKTGNYRCGGKKRDHIAEENICSNRDISEEKVLEVVWNEIEKYLQNPWEAMKRYQEWLEGNNRENRILEAKRQLADIDRKVSTRRVTHKDALRKALEGWENAETYASIAYDLTNELRDLGIASQQVKNELDALNKQDEDMKIVLSRAEEYRGRLGNITLEQKGKLIRELVYQIQLSREHGKIIFNFEKPATTTPEK